MLKKLKRVLSMLLVATIVLTSVPSTVFAAGDSGIAYGDINADGSIDLKDELLLKRYIAEENPEGFNLEYADVNNDGVADLKDLLMLKKYLAEWDIVLGPEDDGDDEDDEYAVTFYDGSRVIDILTAVEGEPLGAVPSVQKSSKANAILMGYYTDAACTQPFYAENPVTQNMSVYAKYEEMEPMEELTFTSFAQMEQTPDISFKIENVSGNIDVNEAVTLIVKDGSDPVELKITGPDNGVYTVSALEGFNPGASYELKLAEGWNFEGKEDSIRTAAFSIDMDEVENLEMSNEIIYIKDTDTMNYTVGSNTIDVLTSEYLSADGGTFTYDKAAELEVDDILCIYVGVNPLERNPQNGKELLDPVVYVKVGAVNGTTVTFAEIGEDERQEIYEIPENFPIIVDALPAGTTGTVNISALDRDMYALMMGEVGTYEDALAAIEQGDFVTLYVSSDAIEDEASLYFGKVTGYDAATGEITYEKTTAEAIESCMDLYADINITGDDIITDEEKEKIEQLMLKQLDDSDFAEEAAFLLADLVTKTNGFRNNERIRDFIIKDATGKELTAEQLELLNLGGSFELTDDIKLTVELIKSGDQLHYKGGLQMAIGIEAEFEVEVEDGDKIAIDLTATFVEEVAINPKIKGKVVKRKLFGLIPVPAGVRVTSNIDIRNYTAFSFEAAIYTVAAEDDSVWDTIKGIMEDPSEIGLDMLPAKYKGMLGNVGDVMGKIEELNSKIDKANETIDTIKGYKEDVEALWAVVEQSNGMTKETWEEMEETLGKTNVASDLLGLMDMTTETGLSTEYIETFEALMEKYSETIQKETDWIKLIDQELFTAEACFYGVAIGMQVDFVVRADMSIAIGSNLEYEVGKRYTFWFEIGLFTPSAGSSTMDLIDEKFAFQFYVMGRIGLRAGIQAKFYVAIGSGKFASVGITAELGPYVKLYGFFVYEYTKYRPANSDISTETERMAGGMFLEFGLYFILGFEAQALGLFEYSYDFLDEEIPLLTAGEKKYYYDFAYEPAEDEMVVVRDTDGNSTNGITAPLNNSLIAVKYMNLTSGNFGENILDYSKYNFTLSNPNFEFDEKTGIISVNVPENTRIMECDLTVTYKYGKCAFSQYDMVVTIPLVWTNLSDAELSEYYTASVRVGNDADGYETVWSTRVLKNQQYDLPTAEEIMELIGWSDAKYEAGTGYGSQATEGLTLIEDEVYDYNVNYKTYSITVTGIQNTDGSTTSKTYYAKYGETFDFSDLKNTGTYKADEYTKFVNVTTDTTIMVNGEAEVIDLTRPINGKVAEALSGNVSATANYVDNGTNVTFTFTGKEHEDITVKLCKGETPDLNVIETIAADLGLAIKDISPAVGKVFAPVTYEITLGELTGPKVTITFEENGGSEVSDITKVVGSIIGNMPTPERTGYTFGGWYTDNGTFATELGTDKMPENGATLYAKWTANEYTVNFHVNGGNELEEADKAKTVAYGSAYGTLPAATKNGYGFVGWFTAAEGGTQVNETDVVSITENQTLYAQWKELKEIPNTVFNFGDAEAATYSKGVAHEVVYDFVSGDGETYTADSFTFKYMRQGNTEYEEGLPVNAGTYNVTISRAADNDYAKFEYTYEAVITVAKAVRDLGVLEFELIDKGYTFLELKLADGVVIDDLSDKAALTYVASVYSDGTVSSNNAFSSADRESTIYYLNADADYAISLKVTGDPNYEDAESTPSTVVSTLDAPIDAWSTEGNYDTSWYDDNAKSFVISTAAELAGLSKLVASNKTFYGKTVTLGADIDLKGLHWYPIGIGVGDTWFGGTFDGAGHTISGIYFKQDWAHAGLFGTVTGATIKNVIVDDSYISGNAHVGGIVGWVSNSAVINNCVSYAVVKGSGIAGGIAGSTGAVFNARVVIANCANYGRVVASTYGGGIVGYVAYLAAVVNNANYGNVSGVSSIGGIVGEIDEGNGVVLSNNYSVGTVLGTGQYIGAVVGRNTDNMGTVKYCYYLSGSATCNGEPRTALGTKTGALTDGDKGTQCAYFTAADSALSRDCGYGTESLISALNDAIGDLIEGCSAWEATGPNGYPLPVSIPTRK